MYRTKALFLFFIVVNPVFSQVLDHWESILYANDTWKYHLGTSDPGSSWNQLDFNDLAWPEGTGGFGYEDGDDNTIISATPSVFIRKKFNITDLSNIAVGLLHMDYDDGFVAYINGTEIARAGITGSPPLYNQLASANHEAQMYTKGVPPEFILSKQVLNQVLREGENLLAIEVHNFTVSSSDLSSNAFLSVGVNDASFTYRATPSWFVPPLVFNQSTLPIVLIETENNAQIIDEPKLNATMKVIRNENGINSITDLANNFDGLIGIELRGSFSQTFPQKSYGIETRDETGENLNVKILGMPKENDWILLTNYNDKSFGRNALAYHLFREMGHYAARTRHCEVMINNIYCGVYVFTEKLKQDNKRVDIAKLDSDDNSGDSLTGGYIFKIDYYTATDSWLSNYHPIDRPDASVHFVYHDPSPEEITAEQKIYLQSYVDQFESVLYGPAWNNPESGYAKYLDTESFVDYFIIGEISRNVDAYKKSRYFFKHQDSDGGLIHSGPVWDFDWAFKNLPDNCNIFNNTNGSGWAYKINGTSCGVSPSPDGWMVRLMQDAAFTARLGNRYHALRQSILSDEYLHHYLDSIAAICSEAQTRHFKKYAILGLNSGAYETDAIPTTYQGEVNKLKTWLDKRMAWLDVNMPSATVTNLSQFNGIRRAPNIRLFPNPAPDFVFVESDRMMVATDLLSLGGHVIRSEKLAVFTHKIDLSGIPKGVYIIRVTLEDASQWSEKLIVK